MLPYCSFSQKRQPDFKTKVILGYTVGIVNDDLVF